MKNQGHAILSAFQRDFQGKHDQYAGFLFDSQVSNDEIDALHMDLYGNNDGSDRDSFGDIEASSRPRFTPIKMFAKGLSPDELGSPIRQPFDLRPSNRQHDMATSMSPIKEATPIIEGAYTEMEDAYNGEVVSEAFLTSLSPRVRSLRQSTIRKRRETELRIQSGHSPQFPSPFLTPKKTPYPPSFSLTNENDFPKTVMRSGNRSLRTPHSKISRSDSLLHNARPISSTPLTPLISIAREKDRELQGEQDHEKDDNVGESLALLSSTKTIPLVESDGEDGNEVFTPRTLRKEVGEGVDPSRDIGESNRYWDNSPTVVDRTATIIMPTPAMTMRRKQVEDSANSPVASVYNFESTALLDATATIGLSYTAPVLRSRDSRKTLILDPVYESSFLDVASLISGNHEEALAEGEDDEDVNKENDKKENSVYLGLSPALSHSLAGGGYFQRGSTPKFAMDTPSQKEEPSPFIGTPMQVSWNPRPKENTPMPLRVQYQQGHEDAMKEGKMREEQEQSSSQRTNEGRIVISTPIVGTPLKLSSHRRRESLAFAGTSKGRDSIDDRGDYRNEETDRDGKVRKSINQILMEEIKQAKIRRQNEAQSAAISRTGFAHRVAHMRQSISQENEQSSSNIQKSTMQKTPMMERILEVEEKEEDENKENTVETPYFDVKSSYSSICGEEMKSSHYTPVWGISPDSVSAPGTRTNMTDRSPLAKGNTDSLTIVNIPVPLIATPIAASRAATPLSSIELTGSLEIANEIGDGNSMAQSPIVLLSMTPSVSPPKEEEDNLNVVSDLATINFGELTTKELNQLVTAQLGLEDPSFTEDIAVQDGRMAASPNNSLSDELSNSDANEDGIEQEELCDMEDIEDIQEQNENTVNVTMNATEALFDQLQTTGIDFPIDTIQEEDEEQEEEDSINITSTLLQKEPSPVVFSSNLSPIQEQNSEELLQFCNSPLSSLPQATATPHAGSPDQVFTTIGEIKKRIRLQEEKNLLLQQNLLLSKQHLPSSHNTPVINSSKKLRTATPSNPIEQDFEPPLPQFGTDSDELDTTKSLEFQACQDFILDIQNWEYGSHILTVDTEERVFNMSIRNVTGFEEQDELTTLIRLHLPSSDPRLYDQFGHEEAETVDVVLHEKTIVAIRNYSHSLVDFSPLESQMEFVVLFRMLRTFWLSLLQKEVLEKNSYVKDQVALIRDLIAAKVRVENLMFNLMNHFLYVSCETLSEETALIKLPGFSMLEQLFPQCRVVMEVELDFHSFFKSCQDKFSCAKNGFSLAILGLGLSVETPANIRPLFPPGVERAKIAQTSSTERPTFHWYREIQQNERDGKKKTEETPRNKSNSLEMETAPDAQATSIESERAEVGERDQVILHQILKFLNSWSSEQIYFFLGDGNTALWQISLRSNQTTKNHLHSNIHAIQKIPLPLT